MYAIAVSETGKETNLFDVNFEVSFESGVEHVKVTGTADNDILGKGFYEITIYTSETIVYTAFCVFIMSSEKNGDIIRYNFESILNFLNDFVESSKPIEITMDTAQYITTRLGLFNITFSVVDRTPEAGRNRTFVINKSMLENLSFVSNGLTTMRMEGRRQISLENVYRYAICESSKVVNAVETMQYDLPVSRFIFHWKEKQGVNNEDVDMEDVYNYYFVGKSKIIECIDREDALSFLYRLPNYTTGSPFRISVVYLNLTNFNAISFFDVNEQQFERKIKNIRSVNELLEIETFFT